ncbi:hypothetical protein Tco_0343549 [Tanacetum coccineum]
MTMHDVVHEMVVGECHEPNSEGSGSAWKAYMNARVAGLFMLVLLEYPQREPLLYMGWMAGPYRCKDATRGRNDDPVTSGIRAKSDRDGPKQNRSSCSPKKFLKVLAAQRWWKCVPGMLKSQFDVVWSSQYRIRWKPGSNGLIQMVDDSRCTLDLNSQKE